MKKLIVLCLVSALMLPACAEMQMPQSNTGKGAVYGTAGGAAAGALAGQLIGRNTKSTLIGAAIGAAVGGVAGASIGQMMDKQEAAFRQALDSQAVEIRRISDQQQQAATSYDQRTANGQQHEAPPQIIALTLKGDVFFKTGSAEVYPGAYPEIDRIAQVITQYPQTTISVEGHTDNVGSDSLNQRLSEQRAQSVASLLSQRGVEYSRITTVGYGKTRPIASNNNEGGKQLNRRVEIRIRPMSNS